MYILFRADYALEVLIRADDQKLSRRLYLFLFFCNGDLIISFNSAKKMKKNVC